MLPVIEKNSLLQIEEIPFRLPSRSSSHHLLIKHSNDKKYFNSWHSRRIQSSLEATFRSPLEEKEQVIAKCLDKDVLSQFSLDLYNKSFEEIYQKRKNQTKQSKSLKDNSFGWLREETMNNCAIDEKPIWIKDLKIWIKNSTSSLEYVKFSKSATMFNNGRSMHMNHRRDNPREQKKCQRFPKHLQFKNLKYKESTLPQQGKQKEKTNKSKDLNETNDRFKSTHTTNDGALKNETKSKENYKKRQLKNIVKEDEIRQPENISKFPLRNDDELSFKKMEKSQSDFSREISVEEEFVPQISSETNLNWAESDFHFTNLSENMLQKKIEESPLKSNDFPEDYHFQEEFEDGSSENQYIEDDNHEDITSRNENTDDDTNDTIANDIEDKDNKNKDNKSNLINIDKNMDGDNNYNEYIYNNNDIDDLKANNSTTKSDITTEISQRIIKMSFELPPLPILLDNESHKSEECPNDELQQSNENERNKFAPLLKKGIRKWGNKKVDLSYFNELERQKKMEERKLKMEKAAKKRKEKYNREGKRTIPDGPRFESYGFLAKYCILKKANVALYRNTFDVCDEDKKQWLTESELLMALRGVNPNLNNYDLLYLNTIIKTCDYSLHYGADFKLFAVLAALSVQITTLDSWIKNLLGNADFKALEKKIYFCRKLWEVCVDPATNTIPLTRLFVELKAGGVSEKHIQDTIKRISWMKEMNLLDFFTYIPLFILMHSSIIENPLDMSDKL